MGHYPPLLWLSTAASLLGSVQFGYHLGVLNTSEAHVEVALGCGERGAQLVGVLLIGATLGSLYAGRVADCLGPRVATVLNNLPLLAGSLACAAARGLPAMLAGRFLAGLGAGAASVLVPRYVSEIAPVSIRGALGTCTQVCINIGILAAYCIGVAYEAGVDTVELLGRPVEWWRIMFATAAGPALLQSAAMALCPESPAWLLRAARPSDAVAALRRLHGTRLRLSDYPKLEAAYVGPLEAVPPPAGADTQQPLLAAEHGGAAEGGGEDGGVGAGAAAAGWASLWEPRYRRVMVLAAALPLTQQASGINTVIFYSSQVFEQAGLRSPVLGSILMGLANLAFTLVAAALMDRAGRRALLLASFSGMAACLSALSAFMLLPTPKAMEGPASLAAIVLYIIFFALGAGPIPWLYMPEILPVEIMGVAQAFCTSLNWAGNLLVSATFPAMLAALGIAGSYCGYAALNAGAAAFLAGRMVETKGLPVDRIRALMVEDSAGNDAGDGAAHGGASQEQR